MRFALLFIFFLLFVAKNFSQKVDDSLLIQKLKDAFFLTNTNPDSALIIGTNGVEQSKKTSNNRLAAFSYKTKGWAYFRIGNFDSCFSNLKIATLLFEQLKDTVETLYMYANLAIVYSNHSQFDKSGAYLMKADSLAKLKKNRKAEAGIKRQMGILYRQQGENEKAIEYLNQSLYLSSELKDTLHIWDVVSSLSIIYNQYLSRPDSSLALLNKAAPLVNGTSGYSYQKATMQEQYGDTWFALASYGKALGHYKTAYNMFGSQDDIADMSFEAINVGKTLLALDRNNEAEKYLLNAYQANDSLKMTNYAFDAATQLAALYKKEKDWRNSFHWLEISFQLNDSLKLTEQNEKIAELQTKYESEKKDVEINLLKKDQALSQLSLQKQKTFRWGAVGLLLLLTTIGFLIINRFRIVQRSKRLIELEKLRNNISRDLHDDMGSALSSINIISKVALENPVERKNANENFKKIMEHSSYIMESMSDIVWTVNPANDSFEKVILRMKEFMADILEPLDIQYEFFKSGDPSSARMDLKKRKDLYLIFKEAVNNAAKYSRCSKITVSIHSAQSVLTMEVNDNGVGFNADAPYSGNGLKNMRQRAEEMNGRFTITSANNEGTKVLVSIKSHE